MLSSKNRLIPQLIFLGILPLFFAACGYQFQDTKNPLAKLGVHKVYVENFRNRSIRPGVEQYFTTAMVREIRKGRVFELTSHKEDADAILSGVIISAQDIPIPFAAEINESTPIQVAGRFTATVGCTVALRDKSDRVIFMDTFSGTKTHPASLVLKGRAQVDQSANATAPLINESEQRLTIRFLSEQMMADAYQKMVDLF